MKKTFILTSLILLLTSISPLGANGAGDCTVSDADWALDNEETSFITLVSNYRVQNGLSAVQSTQYLRKSDQWHANDMYAKNYLSHTDSLGRSWYTRAADCGYPFASSNNLGENAASGYTSASSVFSAWKASPGHNSNMLWPTWNEIGTGKKGGYWSTVYGERLGGDSDTQAPVVSIDSPTTNSTVSGLVDVTITATDNFGVNGVYLGLDSTTNYVASLNTKPYIFSLDTTKYSNGTHTLYVWATDLSLNKGISSPVVININNTGSTDTLPPTVNITSPLNGQTVSGVVSVTATASDNVAVSRVDFYVDSTLKGTAPTTPYSFNWNTATLTNGNHTLEAKGYNAAGNIGSSGIYTVTINNNSIDTITPLVTITSPANGVKVSGTVSIQSTATDNVGVTKMEVYIDNVLKSTVTGASVRLSWNTKKAYTGSHLILVKAYDAAGNIGSSYITVTK